MTDCTVLHVTSLHGGGVDRHVRDLVRGVKRRHLVWHTSPAADVMEVPAENRYLLLDRERVDADPAPLSAWLRAQGVGLVHAHALGTTTRERATWAAHALESPCVTTLHDVLFLRREGFEPGASRDPDPGWLAETSRFLRASSAVTAPSGFIGELAQRHVPGLGVEIIPNGGAMNAQVEVAPRPEFLERRPEHVVAVLGAIGPHKGSELLEAIEPHLAGSGIAIVVIGYTDRQLTAAWRHDALFVHGAFRDEEAGAWLRAYGAELALFANAVPESFSYALSDAWSAGLPVLVPPEGALAERVKRHGGGWLLPERFGPAEVAAELKRLFAPQAQAERARVKSELARPDAQRVPSLDDMDHSFDALYRRYGVERGTSAVAASESIDRLLATQIDSALFRAELVQVANALEQERRAMGTTIDNQQLWIAKLEVDIASLKMSIEEINAERRKLEAEMALLTGRGFMGLVRRALRKIGHARG